MLNRLRRRGCGGYGRVVKQFSGSHVAAALVLCAAASPLAWIAVDAASGPDRVETGASAPECPAERFTSFPLDDDEYFIRQRIKFMLPTDLATRDRADADTAARPADGFALDLPLTDEEVDAFLESNVHQDLMEPLRSYFATIPDVVGAVAFNGNVLDPLFRIETTADISPEQLREIERLTPREVPTAAVTVEWSRSELQALMADIAAGIRGEPTTLGAFDRIVALGLVPHDGGIGAEQHIRVFVDESDLGCDAQLDVSAADALADLDVPPVVIEQSSRAEES